MENSREDPTTVRIQWTPELNESLLELAPEAEPNKRGYWQRLAELWKSYHATLPSRGASLARRYNRLIEQRQSTQSRTEQVPSKRWPQILSKWSRMEQVLSKSWPQKLIVPRMTH